MNVATQLARSTQTPGMAKQAAEDGLLTSVSACSQDTSLSQSSIETDNPPTKQALLP